MCISCKFKIRFEKKPISQLVSAFQIKTSNEMCELYTCFIHIVEATTDGVKFCQTALAQRRKRTLTSYIHTHSLTTKTGRMTTEAFAHYA